MNAPGKEKSQLPIHGIQIVPVSVQCNLHNPHGLVALQRRECNYTVAYVDLQLLFRIVMYMWKEGCKPPLIHKCINSNNSFGRHLEDWPCDGWGHLHGAIWHNCWIGITLFIKNGIDLHFFIIFYFVYLNK